MKARVKGTTNIIEVEFSAGALNACYPPYYDRENNMYYEAEQLVWVDNEGNAEPDYWTRLEHQAGIAAMQGILTNPIGFENLRARGIDLQKEAAQLASEFAHALVEKMKESV